MARVRLDDISFGDDEVDEAFQKWRESIEEAHNWKVTGHAEFLATPGGYALHVKGATRVKIAKTGGTAIPAMSGSTPGSGTITLYNMGATALTSSGVTETALNLHPTETVSANAWIKVIEIDGRWWVFWEPCS